MANPDWLPVAPSGDVPAIYGDFAGGHYWANGAEQADVTDVYYDNPAWNPHWDPSVIVDGSGVPCDASQSIGASVIVDLLAPLFGALPVTVVIVVTIGDGGASNTTYAEIDVYDDTFATDGYGAVLANPGTYNLEIVPLDESATVDSDPVNLPTDNTITLAFNMYADHVIASINGADNVEADGSDLSVTPNETSLYSRAMDPTSFVKSWAIYAGQPDSDLPAMSGGVVPPPTPITYSTADLSKVVIGRVAFGVAQWDVSIIPFIAKGAVPS